MKPRPCDSAPKLLKPASLSNLKTLPAIVGIAISDAFGSSPVPAQTPLINLPRFLHSRTLKNRPNWLRSTETSMQAQSFCFRPASIGLSQSASDLSCDFVPQVDINKILLKHKNTPADMLRASSICTADTGVQTLTKKLNFDDYSMWLEKYRKDEGISLRKKRRKMKIVVSLPKTTKQSSGSTQKQGANPPILKKLPWSQEADIGFAQEERNHFLRLNLATRN